MKARIVDEHSKAHEVSHPSEPERMLKDCTEAATEELSRNTIELKEKKKKSEAQEEGERIKKKKTRKTITRGCILKKTTEGRRGGF